MNINIEELKVDMGIAAATIATQHSDKSTSVEKQALLQKLGSELSSQWDKLDVTDRKDTQALGAIRDAVNYIQLRLELTTLLGHVLDQAKKATQISLSKTQSSLYGSHVQHLAAQVTSSPVSRMAKAR